MNPTIKAKWTAALRSGEFRQGRQVLRNAPQADGIRDYCCLGVLCELHRRETGEGEWFGSRYKPSRGDDSASSLPSAVARWAGLVIGDGPNGNPFLKNEFGQQYTATFWNDNHCARFPQIADLIDRSL